MPLPTVLLEDRIPGCNVPVALEPEFLEVLLEHLLEKRLTRCDLIVAVVILRQLDPLTGKAHITASAIGPQARRNGMGVSQSLQKLAAVGLIVRVKEARSGGTCFLVNPAAIQMGQPDTRRRIFERWRAATATPPPTTTEEP